MTPREMLELAAKAAGYTVNARMQAERDALGFGDAGRGLMISAHAGTHETAVSILLCLRFALVFLCGETVT